MEYWAGVLIIFDVIVSISSANVPSGICQLEVTQDSVDDYIPKYKQSPDRIRNGTKPGSLIIDICCTGYQFGSAPQPPYCVPDCPNGCGYKGSCIAPNECSCRSNAFMNIYTTMGPGNICIPMCPISCLNGICVKYGGCKCNKGFNRALENSAYCKRGCTKDCESKGECDVEKNLCKCYMGYQVTKEGVCDIFCEEGYEQVGKGCEPVCSGGCQNGTCISPNKCACKSGWALDSSGKICNPVCDIPCQNSICTAPNTCTCKQSYMKDPSAAEHICVPYCLFECLNGYCSAPNVCTCNRGYVNEYILPPVVVITNIKRS